MHCIQYSQVFCIGLTFYYASFRDYSLDLFVSSDLVIESRAYCTSSPLESDTFTFTHHWFIRHITHYLLKQSICASLTEAMATSTDDAETALVCPVRQCHLWNKTRTKRDCNVCQSVAISRERFCASSLQWGGLLQQAVQGAPSPKTVLSSCCS